MSDEKTAPAKVESSKELASAITKATGVPAKSGPGALDTSKVTETPLPAHTSPPEKVPEVTPLPCCTLMIDKVYREGNVITKEESGEEQIEVRSYPETVPLAEVSYGCKMTLNLGNFESVSVNVSTKLPSSVEELDDAYATAKAFVDKKLNAEVSGIRAYREKKKAGA